MFHLSELFTLLQILLLDLSMAGDNALVVGMAAAGLEINQRHQAVIFGIVGATVLRILFAIFAVQIFHLTGLLIAGGLLLLWIAWRMYRDLRHAKHEEMHRSLEPKRIPKKLSTAVWQIIAADISMSLDNVLGVAGIARDHLWVLATGLILSVALMGLASSFVARLAARHTWINYLGLAVVLYTAVRMIVDGLKPFSV
jgi:YjbE family integral membrane protein